MKAMQVVRQGAVWLALAVAMILIFAVPARASADDSKWRGEYYDNDHLAGNPAFVRHDKAVDFNWGNGRPDGRVDRDHFSVRWTRDVYFKSGTYRFISQSDDGVRLYVDGRLVIDEWRDMDNDTHSTRVELSSGDHNLRLEYFERSGKALAHLRWERVASPDRGNIITCVRPSDSWIKVYGLENGQWIDLNPHGWGPLNASGFLKLDGFTVDSGRYGANGHPYKVELWAGGQLVRSVGDTARGEPEFRLHAGFDSTTPWGCPAP